MFLIVTVTLDTVAKPQLKTSFKIPLLKKRCAKTLNLFNCLGHQCYDTIRAMHHESYVLPVQSSLQNSKNIQFMQCQTFLFIMYHVCTYNCQFAQSARSSFLSPIPLSLLLVRLAAQVTHRNATVPHIQSNACSFEVSNKYPSTFVQDKRKTNMFFPKVKGNAQTRVLAQVVHQVGVDSCSRFSQVYRIVWLRWFDRPLPPH